MRGATRSAPLADVLDRVLAKGIVITREADRTGVARRGRGPKRVVVRSLETHVVDEPLPDLRAEVSEALVDAAAVYLHRVLIPPRR